MKIKSLLLAGLLAGITSGVNAQSWITDSFTVGANYKDNVFYSLKQGETKKVEANNWHLGFSAARMDAGIITNSADKSVKVYLLSTDTTTFGTDLTADFLTVVNDSATKTPFYNSNVTWETGAFNQNSAGGFDYGWGTYDMSSHLVKGKAIYALTTATDTFQFFFQSKNGLSTTANGPIYDFKYAKIDGSSVISKSIALGQTAFEGQNFVYYNIDTDTLISREPKSADWDILFTNYNDESVQFSFQWYKVFGALANKNTSIAKYAVDEFVQHDTLKYDELNLTYDTAIASLGYNKWKATANGGTAFDTISFFVKTAAKDIYQVVFTQFVSGLDTVNPGKIVLQKRLVYEEPADTGTSIDRLNTSINALVLAPNPVSNGNTNLVIDAKENINNVVLSVSDINGRVLYTQNIKVRQGFYQYPLSVSNLSNGMYMVTLKGEGVAQTQKLIVQ